MNRIVLLLVALALLCAVLPASGETWYVDGSVSASGDGKTWETAFKAIQQGIDAASNGDTVIVAEGTYIENIHFNRKNIILTSTDPLRSSVVYSTTIDGGEVGSVVTFSGTEDESCVLSGFTIMDGIAEYGGGICGGTPDTHSHATIENNSIGRNTAQWGGGAAHCDGTIRNNTFIVNTATLDGGGLYDCDGAIRDNTISWSFADCGGGLYGCDGTILGNGVGNNSALDGGGMAYCEGMIRQNSMGYDRAAYAGGALYKCSGAIVDNGFGLNTALDGGALSHCDGIIKDNYIHGNNAEYGAGLYRCNGTIQNNIIGWNPAFDGEGAPPKHIYGNKAEQGGGLAYCSGTIRSNTIMANSASCGGGLSSCDATIDSNLISENSAEHSGGGVYDCNGIIQNNFVTDNVTGDKGYGAGLYRCHGDVRNNTIAGNQAYWGGGLAYCRGTVRSNIISNNLAIVEGGGLYRCAAPILDNTVVGNSADCGGGLAFCNATITNCIIWGNSAGHDAQLRDSGEPTHSCIQNWTLGGEGNIADEPRFLDPDGTDDNPETYDDNDYHLSVESPCIDAGDNTLLDPPGLDMDGNLRIAFGKQSLTVDMGAYEYNSVPFAAAQVIRNPNGALVLTWNSQPNDICVVWSCADLSAGAWMEQAIVPSDKATCSWADTTPPGSLNFYRIQMK